jgi:hypothetical protein
MRRADRRAKLQRKLAAPWVAPPSGEPIVEEVAAMVRALEADRVQQEEQHGAADDDPRTVDEIIENP